MKRIAVLSFTLVSLAAFIAFPGPGGQGSPDAASFRGITDAFAPVRGIVRDTNGDGLADVVAARIIVAAKPAVEDVLAAANLAARLGYETLSMNLPLVYSEETAARLQEVALPVLIGRENTAINRLVEQGVLDIKSLKPGQGLIAFVPAPLGGPGGIAVVGGDDAGTLVAANELSVRLPRVWSMSGIHLQGIEEQALQYLRARGVSAAGASIRSMIVDSDRRGIARLDLRIDVADADGARAQKLMEELDAAHRRGLEPRTLNFANVAVIDCEVLAAGKAFSRTAVARSGLNPRTLTPPIDPDELAQDTPPGGQAPSAPGKSFDLTSCYSIDGWYGDAYPDLIPDRTETSLIVGEAGEALGAAHIAARVGLESTGITLPISKPDRTVKEPNREASPILVGRSNQLVQQLVKIGKTRLNDLSPAKDRYTSCPGRSETPRPQWLPAATQRGPARPATISRAAYPTSGMWREAHRSSPTWLPE